MALRCLICCGIGIENLGVGWNSVELRWHWQVVEWSEVEFVGLTDKNTTESLLPIYIQDVTLGYMDLLHVLRLDDRIGSNLHCIKMIRRESLF